MAPKTEIEQFQKEEQSATIELIKALTEITSKNEELELFTVDQITKKLKISKELAYKLINKGLLVGLKLGRLKVTKASLEEFIHKYNGKDLSDLDNIKDLYNQEAS